MEERIRQRERGERGYGGRNEEDPLGGRGRSGTPWRRGEGQNATTDQPHEPGTHPPPDQPQEAAPTTSTSHKTHSHRPRRNLPKTTHPKTHHNHPKTTPPKQTTPQKTKKVYPGGGDAPATSVVKEGVGEEKFLRRTNEYTKMSTRLICSPQKFLLFHALFLFSRGSLISLPLLLVS